VRLTRLILLLGIIIQVKIPNGFLAGGVALQLKVVG
jgi:hypothetical protein